jgi:multiple antibiotic resistance protein
MDELMIVLAKGLTTLVLILNPVAAAALFVTMTAQDDAVRRRRTARTAALTVAAVLVTAAYAGQALLGLFGVSLDGLRVFGGLLLLLIAAEMMGARPSRTTTSDAETAAGVAKPDVGITPLGIPVLAGPGSILTVMVMHADLQARALPGWSLLGPIVLAAIATWITLRLASALHDRIGPIAIGIGSRLMGLMLGALAVEMMLEGIRSLLHLGTP